MAVCARAMASVVWRIAPLLLLMVHSGSHAYPWGAPESSCEDGFIPGVMGFLASCGQLGRFHSVSLLHSLSLLSRSQPVQPPARPPTPPRSPGHASLLIPFLACDAISLQVHTGFFPKGFRRSVHGECARCFAPHTAMSSACVKSSPRLAIVLVPCIHSTLALQWRHPAALPNELRFAAQ